MIPGLIESDICLKPMVSEQSAALLRLHKHYKAGHLLLAGGIADQPHYYNEAMAIIDGLAHSFDSDS